MSSDPEDGNPVDPKTLHKYLYADGDPINGRDPSGRADIINYVEVNLSAPARVYLIAGRIVVWECRIIAAYDLYNIATHKETPTPLTVFCDIASFFNF